MATANILGGNPIMLALFLPADLFSRHGPILSDADGAAKFNLTTGILVTAAAWLAGESDVMGELRQPIGGPSSAIHDILARDKEWAEANEHRRTQ